MKRLFILVVTAIFFIPCVWSDASYFELRGGLDNCRIKFSLEKKGRVVYLGGSITTMNGWRALTYDLLKKRFPETEFDFIDAGIGGTNSTLGAFRFERDVFKSGPVDLLFLEFAVNDGGGDSVNNRRARAMEGIVRHARKLNPKIDIIMQYFVTQGYVKEITEGKTPSSITVHDEVARHYNIPIINMAVEMTRQINDGVFTWEQFSRDSCHPLPYGHERYIECIDAFMNAVWAKPLPPNASIEEHLLPKPLDPMNYENGRYIDAQKAKIVKGWKFVEGWKADKTCNYSGPVDVLTAENPGDELQISFNGSLIAIYAIAGFDAGTIECSVDGGKWKTVDLFDFYCTKFHRPVCHVLAENLKPSEHLITIRMKEEQNEKSAGHACRILKWAAN